MKFYDVIIIDGVNLFFRVFHALSKDIKNDNEKYYKKMITKYVQRFIQLVEKQEKKFLSKFGNPVIIGFDNPKSKESNRKLIDPEYKITRKRYPKSFWAVLKMIQSILLNYKDNYKIVYKHTYEFDDVLYNIVNKYDDKNRILLISSDMDFSRLISENIHWYNFNTIFDKITFLNKYNFIPSKESVTLYKSIRGDNSDNIPVSVPHLSLSKLVRIVSEFKNVNDLLNHMEIIDYLSRKDKDKFIQNKDRLLLNEQLVEFYEIKSVNNFIFDCKFTPEILLIYYRHVEIDFNKFDFRISKYIKRKSKKTLFIKRKIKSVGG